MAKNKQKDLNRGSQGFNSYYKEIFGERWEVLKEALLKESVPVSYNLSKIKGEEDGELRTYYLDAASILAAFSLPLKGAEEILDLCAAPGGKTLVISSLMDEDSKLTSNERSAERKHRLSKVVEEHIPSRIKENITVTCSDGAVWCKTKSNCFDRILLDAPCSSERHVLQDEKYLAQWSPARIKTLSMEQWALLSSAYRMLKDNGILLYSTCALAPKENDEVIERLFKKFDNCVNLSFESEKYQNLKNDEAKLQLFTDNVSLPDFERTKYGYQILPDKQNGAGPIYFSIIMKKLNISSN
ncbi:MAG: RsmB/NOP family class I SAM-dependent RNA methyltransferase [Treponema sp.]|uniref:RsmB/NOP family class I SAM-dependent RNA methyltransferase n=1 Tax=Treponema sp. TaxID=166 RepID=UPI00298D7F3B|nr:RsmB/NOP family class I SAM-dependent RNA methyltransferase [Treponema sp.]MDD5811210.1 RsmB/NOP family class I SAM-dependent RNA methyltransferase [Treponema sp.]